MMWNICFTMAALLIFAAGLVFVFRKYTYGEYQKKGFLFGFFTAFFWSLGKNIKSATGESFLNP